MASGIDGYFNAGYPWILNSPSNVFDQQGCVAQMVVQLTGPQTAFRGSGQFFAIDSALGSALTLRRIDQPLNAGMPPAPAAGLTGVSFIVNTLNPQIENATRDIKSRYGIDEMVFYRASLWMYQGVEDLYRDCRDVTVLETLYQRYQHEARVDKGDFAKKAKTFKQEFEESMNQVQIRWGPFGNSQPPATKFGTRFAR